MCGFGEMGSAGGYNEADESVAEDVGDETVGD